MWSFIESFKKDRVIILTTHSMEEADVLGDRIAIMAHGRLRGLGTSIHLKSKFGTGYRISLIVSKRFQDQVKDIVQDMVPSAVLEDDSAGSLIYQFQSESISMIPRFVNYLEQNPDRLIKAWGISHSTLEEVFLKLIRAANPKGYSGYER